MNELVFFTHILAELFFLAVAVRMGQKALMIFVVLSALLANLFVLKQTVLFGLQVTCSDVFIIGGILGLNLLQDLYGKEVARSALRVSTFALIVYIVMSQIHLFYAPSSFDRAHVAYTVIFGQAPRIVAASLGVYYIVQRVGVWLFALLAKFKLHLSLRLVIGLVIDQALDTVLFTFLGLYGLIESPLDVMMIAFAMKCLVIVCASPVAAACKRLVRQGEA